MFSCDGWLPRVLRVATLAAVSGLLAACGGGEQVKKFVADRVLAFGDETSVIESDHTKYTVNFVSGPTDTPPSTLDCVQNPLWIQFVAGAYGVPFAECPGTATNAPSRILAKANTGVSDVSRQIDDFLLADAFRSDDLVTIYSGTNDIRALYQSLVSGALTADQAVASAEALGTALAGQVNRVAEAGAKVLIATIPNQGLTPDGRTDATKATTLQQLTQRFNAKLRIGLTDDGRKIGLVLFDESMQSLAVNPAYNLVDMLCNDATIANVRTCSTQTLRVLPDGTVGLITTWLWADAFHIAPAAHGNLGTLAVTRATNNPF